MNFQELAKSLAKLALTAVIWVFVFSIRVNDQTLFDHAHGILVDNPLVETVDESLGDLWYKVSETARVTFRDMSIPDKEKA